MRCGWSTLTFSWNVTLQDLFLKWLFHVMMLGKNVIFYSDADVVHRIGCNMQRLWRMEKDKDPTTAPFYHARLPVYYYVILLSRVPRPATCISLTSTVCKSEQRVAAISRYICFFHRFRCCCVREA